MACGVALKRSLDIELLHSPENSIKRRRTSTAGHCSPYSPPFTQTSASSTSPKSSTFGEKAKLYQNDLQNYLHSEIRRSFRKRKIDFKREQCTSPPCSPAFASDSDHEQRMDSVDFDHVDFGALHKSKDDTIFNVKQVQLICQRLLKEQAEKLRDEYDQTLTSRMAEQYDTFMLFTYDQIHRNIQGSSISYLS